MSDLITDEQIAEWETDLASGYTVDSHLGLAFLKVVDRMRKAEEERDLLRLASLIVEHGADAVREALRE